MSDAPAQAKIPGVKPPEEEFLFVDAAWELRQSYRRDPLQRPFFAGLKEKRLLGVRDPASGRVLFPPRSLWDEPYAELHDLAPVGPGGVIRTLTRVPGGSGPNSRPPQLVVFVQLDGASTAASGTLRGPGSDTADPIRLIGARCKAVFKPEPAGDWNDYWYELEGEP